MNEANDKAVVAAKALLPGKFLLLVVADSPNELARAEVVFSEPVQYTMLPIYLRIVADKIDYL